MEAFYSSGLQAKGHTEVETVQYISNRGHIIVQVGDIVKPGDIIGYRSSQGQLMAIDLALELDVSPFDVPHCVLLPEGTMMTEGTVIARQPSYFGGREYVAPFDCILERVTAYSGRITIRGNPPPLFTKFPGTVSRIMPGKGVVIRGAGAFIQGAFGIGSEVYGPLFNLKCQGPVLRAQDIKDEYQGSILMFPGEVSLSALREAENYGVKGLILGSISKQTLDAYLGYELGTAVTCIKGRLCLVITEGFGKFKMNKTVRDILLANGGMVACCSGVTQVRAGVKRPYVFISQQENQLPHRGKKQEQCLVRLLSSSRFGRLAMLQQVLPFPQILSSGIVTQVARVKMFCGTEVVVPIQNLEILDDTYQGGKP